MLIEICANSYESAAIAQKAGAHRIELCSELAVGGLTPSHGLLQKVIEEISIETYVLIRPRSGDFTYTNEEFDIMKKDIAYCKQLGCGGIVSGVLNSDHTIDIERTKELVELAHPLSFTFHRAFDWVINQVEALDHLCDLGVSRILTSGQQTTALKGLDHLKKLQLHAKQTCLILPGGGINKSNAMQFKNAGFNELHLSATQLHTTIDKPAVSMNSERFFDETQRATSDLETIKTILDLVK